ncbi:MAG: branched-chain amino acid transport system permease protein [Gaiellaceae bacterium]|jgi:branched-chain amino acid transport system permease protein|nr:branched-chain amino acid transport system permease protein [Gaiellaceae bacterium]MDX6471367.1 branched-chain amino acid transport system permease protein [Gaiellaceae bacterium]
MNWNLFVTEIVAGVTHGSLYALIALGYSMVYGILKLLNFAHGDIFMVGAFIGYGLMTLFGNPETLTVNLAFLIALMLVCSMIGGGLLGVMVERFAYRRLRKAPRIAPLITALGVSFFLENAAQLVLGAEPVSYNTYAWKNSVLWTKGFTLPGNVHVGLPQLIVVVGAIVLVVLLTLFVQRTQTGKAMRATSFDQEAAAMMGIDVDRVIVVTFFIGSALAGAAGVFNGLVYQQTFPYMGFQAGLFAFTAAVVGGIGNLPGAVLGGLLIGLAEAFATGYLSSTFQQAIVFALLIAVMIVRPSGLLGRAAVQKV